MAWKKTPSKDHVFKSFLELKKILQVVKIHPQIKSLKNPIGCNMNIIIIYYYTQDKRNGGP
jgi:hypothetical protein